MCLDMDNCKRRKDLFFKCVLLLQCTLSVMSVVHNRIKVSYFLLQLKSLYIYKGSNLLYVSKLVLCFAKIIIKTMIGTFSAFLSLIKLFCYFHLNDKFWFTIWLHLSVFRCLCMVKKDNLCIIHAENGLICPILDISSVFL